MKQLNGDTKIMEGQEEWLNARPMTGVHRQPISCEADKTIYNCDSINLFENPSLLLDASFMPNL